MLIVKLKEKKHLHLFNGHPWVFAGAIDEVTGSDDDNTGLCRVINDKGRFVCLGLYNPYAQIAVRLLTLNKESIDRDFFMRRIKAAIEMRKGLISSDTNCYRLVNAEGDFLPGLVADRYAETVVLQFGCPGMEQFKDEIISIFEELFPGAYIHERSDMRSRKAERLMPESGPLCGQRENGEVVINENGLQLAVDIFTGDRTGHYIDQRATRRRLMEMAQDKTVLDLFCGGASFAVHALKGGAKSATCVDTSAPTQLSVKRNMELNQIDSSRWQHEKADAARFLSKNSDHFDIVVLDPPPHSEAEDYVKLNSAALKVVSKGGYLFTSMALQTQLDVKSFMRILSKAAYVAGREVQVVDTIQQPADFPYRVSHPEGRHLCGFILYVQ